MSKFVRKYGAAGAALVVASGAQAAAVDVTAVTADLTAQLTPIAAVGAGVLLVVVAVKAFKWVRSALS
jgi:hypothetical protein